VADGELTGQDLKVGSSPRGPVHDDVAEVVSGSGVCRQRGAPVISGGEGIVLWPEGGKGVRFV
jgi:hypothetical protein